MYVAHDTAVLFEYGNQKFYEYFCCSENIQYNMIFSFPLGYSHGVQFRFHQGGVELDFNKIRMGYMVKCNSNDFQQLLEKHSVYLTTLT
jgi:hypothetical protein